MAESSKRRTIAGFYGPILVGALLLLVVGWLIYLLASGVREGRSVDDVGLGHASGESSAAIPDVGER